MIKNLINLDDLERYKLALFIASLMQRTKAELKQTEKQTNEFNSFIKEATNINQAKIDYKQIWFSMLAESPKFADILLKKVWQLIESDNEFYISDNPVVKQNTINRSETRGTLGLDSYGIEIYLPLSHSLTIALYCEKLFIENNYTEKYLELTQALPENIENYNWLQVIYANRFIFSSTNNFDLAKDILKK